MYLLIQKTLKKREQQATGGVGHCFQWITGLEGVVWRFIWNS